jgi:hypothetical protein
MNIYVASSWRNPWQPGVVNLLRELGHEVYDFRNPREGDVGFSWREVDPEWKGWNPERYRKGLAHPTAQAGFKSDMDALKWADACVAVLPHGRSAALELGWACGAGKKTATFFPVDVPLTPVAGHSSDSGKHCDVCNGPDPNAIGCLLPRKLYEVEPELMVLMADWLLIGREELIHWASR